MANRLQVDLPIIIFTTYQFSGICDRILEPFEHYRRRVLQLKDNELRYPTLTSKQMVIALEFFLQFDGKLLSYINIISVLVNNCFSVLVDVFYMKTCSFRGAQPPSNSEGLFCGLNEPEGRYVIQPCWNLFCPCCHPVNHSKKTNAWPVVDFISSSTHRFTNGYTTYLNCPAVRFFFKTYLFLTRIDDRYFSFRHVIQEI